MEIMKRVSVSDLRHNFDPVERGLRQGKSFESTTKYGRVVAILDQPDNRKATPRGRALMPPRIEIVENEIADRYRLDEL
jgi:hypothetical protein